MKLTKTLTAVSGTILCALLLTGCGVPAGQLGIRVAESAQSAGERLPSLDSILEEAGDDEAAAVEADASEAGAEAFFEFYLNKANDPAVFIEISEIVNIHGIAAGLSNEEIVNLYPMSKYHDYTGVTEQDQVEFVAYSISDMLLNVDPTQNPTVYEVNEGAASLHTTDSGQLKAIVDTSSVSLADEAAAQEMTLKGSYYLVFTDDGWKIDVSETINNIR